MVMDEMKQKRLQMFVISGRVKGKGELQKYKIFKL